MIRKSDTLEMEDGMEQLTLAARPMNLEYPSGCTLLIRIR